MSKKDLVPVVVPNDGYRELDPRTLLDQIGVGNVLAISGGRVNPLVTKTEDGYLVVGVSLPVGHGYSVEVVHNFLDYYNVARVFTRSGVRSVKGELKDVDAWGVGEAAYQASCYVNVPFPEEG